ncbi:putative Xaa-Pro dipeptide hydrolase [Podospora fimiseda]|uniref:Xaa-Pro dipeptide hydrolase n=1 Tax=Podospora fimiseda TaxID=252190 RepID=A0AAN7BZC0_9PEZI|nr:putative Xaa-Pro dipeptide hydrolase [Podospora fimiseda]
MPTSTFQIHTSVLFDPKKRVFLKNISLEIDPLSGEIVDTTTRTDQEDASLIITKSSRDIDLRGKIVLPGLVDAHTHIFIHDYNERNGTQQMRDQSIIERTIRASNHARAALLAGYTTYRDLGTEALGNADANLRDCINRGLTPGPRLFVATDALASSGSYELRVENRLGNDGSNRVGLSVPRAADQADGIWGVRAGVRRRISEGADVIKFYADYRRRTMRWPSDVRGPGGKVLHPPKQRNPAVPLYTQEEMKAIVEEAKLLAEAPVAAHTGETRTAIWASQAGVTTVEHVFEDSYGVEEEMFRVLKENKTIWVPTLATAEELPAEMFEACKRRVRRAYERGVKIAAGGDTGTFNHGLNVKEIEIMVECGMKIEDALEAATILGWEACGGDMSGFRFGWFEKGNRADVIALDSDPREDKKALRKVGFVMKDGKVWKRDGVAVDMIVVPQWPGESDVSGGETSSSEEWSDLEVVEPKQAAMVVPVPVCKPGKPSGSS